MTIFYYAEIDHARVLPYLRFDYCKRTTKSAYFALSSLGEHCVA